MPRADAKRIWGRSGVQNGKGRGVMDQREIPSLPVRAKWKGPALEKQAGSKSSAKKK